MTFHDYRNVMGRRTLVHSAAHAGFKVDETKLDILSKKNGENNDRRKKKLERIENIITREI